MKEVLVFTATYNEADNIASLVEEVFAALPRSEMLVVDDNSPDGTGRILDELAAKDARLAQIVDLRYFCGYTLEEIAAMQGRSLRTIHREWEKARTILFAELQPPS